MRKEGVTSKISAIQDVKWNTHPSRPFYLETPGGDLDGAGGGVAQTNVF
jgi:hypothetical protein